MIVLTPREAVTNKLAFLRTLDRDNWDGYGDRAITQTACDYYQKVLDLIDDKYLREAEPCGHNGGLHLEWDNGDWAYTATIEHDGSLWLFVLAPDDAEDSAREIVNPQPADLIAFIHETATPR